MQTVQDISTAKRHDIYSHIHKALRAFMADTMVRLGRFDGSDDTETAALVAQVKALCTFTESHLKHEDEHVHPAMEQASPGSTRAAATEHPQHVEECRRISALADRVLAAPAEARGALAAQLYHALCLFMAECLEHMHMEETDNNQVLWAAYSDAQLHAIEMGIVATLTPEEHGMTLQWMIPSMTPEERLGMLGGVKMGAPVQVFCAMMEALRQFLPARQWQQLADGLGYEAPLLAA
jgi:hypothetical protein